MNTSEHDHTAQFRQAIAYCLAYERLGAERAVVLKQRAEDYARTPRPPEDLPGKILYYADLATQVPDIGPDTMPAEHPLRQAWQKMGFDNPQVIGLVYGGATKIKEYVFESARLPEVRGASALLDRINMVDIRALWGKTFEDRDRQQRAKQVQGEYKRVQAPECIIYAGGGNFLAFAPVSIANQMADQVEQLYTTETLTANSAVVAGSFSLLELLYGRQPDRYWLDDFQTQRENADLRPLLEGYYGSTEDADFTRRKCFAELVTVLARAMMRRREEGGDADGRQRRYIPHYELLPYAVKCHSCDVRPAVIRDEAANKEYCEPCARKRVAGQAAKKEVEQAQRWFTQVFTDWSPQGIGSWESRFNDFLEKHPQFADRYYRDWPRDERPSLWPANDLHEIGRATSPDRYVGLIYADGNDIGAKVASIASAAEYSLFSEELFQATQTAVFEALAQHLQPVWIETAADPARPERHHIWVHPWEIITIGGDDLITIVPGNKALDVALSVGEKFEQHFPGKEKCLRYEGQRYHPHHIEQSENRQALVPVPDETVYAPRVSLSAGVVVAHETTPIFFLWELAEQLINSAKRWRKELNRQREKQEQRPYKSGTVDFIVLKSMGMVSSRLKEFRERAYQPEEDLWLTGRPYTWVELDGLLNAARAIHKSGLGRSQVYRLQDFLTQGKTAAAINYLYAFARLGAEERQELARAFHLAWHDSTDTPPWRGRTDGKGVETIWCDLVEIHDFVREEGEYG